ncbi:MAG: hypothetical protein R2805_09850 [Flavobacterium sp.]|jgi:hypothetical protein|nr:hypothetical protein [Bacteroidota bacterium]
MKQLLMNDYTLMLESDKKAKNIITIVVLFAIFLIVCELYILIISK